MVYERYARVGSTLTQESESNDGQRGVLVPGRNIPQSEMGPTYGVTDPVSGLHQAYPAVDGFPFEVVSEEELESSISSL